MTLDPGLNVAWTEAQIDELLLELNTRIAGPDQLRAWASDTTVEIDRLTATPTLTYIRLGRTDATGDSIVLMLLDGVWERTL